MLTASLVLSAALSPALSMGCSRADSLSPTAPASADFTGVWEGQARILSCAGSTCDPRTCGNMLGRGAPGGDQRNIRISLIQTSTDVSGSLNTDRATTVERVESIRGTVRDSTTVVLEGDLTTGTPPDQVVTRVSDLVATKSSNNLQGVFNYSINRPGSAAGISCGSFRDDIQLKYEFSGLQRVPR